MENDKRQQQQQQYGRRHIYIAAVIGFALGALVLFLCLHVPWFRCCNSKCDTAALFPNNSADTVDVNTLNNTFICYQPFYANYSPNQLFNNLGTLGAIRLQPKLCGVSYVQPYGPSNTTGTALTISVNL